MFLNSTSPTGWGEGSLCGLDSVGPAEAAVPAACALHGAAGGGWWVRPVPLQRCLDCVHRTFCGGGEKDRRKLCCYSWRWGAKDWASEVVCFSLQLCLFVVIIINDIKYKWQSKMTSNWITDCILCLAAWGVWESLCLRLNWSTTEDHHCGSLQ